jgi:hypothetical protein
MHPHRQILPLGIGRADIPSIWIARYPAALGTDALGRAVPLLGSRIGTVQFDQHGVVNVIAVLLAWAPDLRFHPSQCQQWSWQAG